jgi:hypothetical protein
MHQRTPLFSCQKHEIQIKGCPFWPFEMFKRNAVSRREGQHRRAAVGLVLSIAGDHGLLYEILILSDEFQKGDLIQVTCWSLSLRQLLRDREV